MPNLYIIGGPNGSGKTTSALKILPQFVCKEYVNADTIAAGLSQFSPEAVALQAGRLMLQRIRHLASEKESFAFETTLAASSLATFSRICQEQGYTVYLLYFWLQSADMAVERVRQRVAKGGHSIPEEVIRRRYESSRKNFISLFMPFVDYWHVYDNSGASAVLAASGKGGQVKTVALPLVWKMISLPQL